MNLTRSRICDGCGRTTAVRWVARARRWLCQPCRRSYEAGTATGRLTRLPTGYSW